MAEQDIIQNMISRLGQSQGERLPPELAADYFRIDDRDGATLLAQARKLAMHLNFYRHDPKVSNGDWQSFFPADDDAALLADASGNTPPHLGLLGAALALYGQPQAELNAFTARHLDFQYRRVLGFAPLPARPDHAHLLFELKKGAAATRIDTTQRFSAGKGKDGVEQLYKPVRDVVITTAKVAALHSVFRDDHGVRFAPVANSADGLGAALPATSPSWRPFGGSELPAAPIGFALASPLLRLAQGSRTISMTLNVSQLDPAVHAPGLLAEAFEGYVTGPKGWLGPYVPSCSVSGSSIVLGLTVPATDPAVVPYQPDLHGMAFATQEPLVQLQLRPEAALRYPALEALTLGVVQLHVNVSGLEALLLENDNGALDPKKAFLPFGPLPVPGSRFMIGSSEALSKRLTDLSVRLRWHAPPANLGTHYAGYSRVGLISNGVNGRLVYQDRSGQVSSVSQDIMLRDANGQTVLTPHPTSPAAEGKSESHDRTLFSLLFSGSGIGRLLGRQRKLRLPLLNRVHVPPPAPRNGFITLSLEGDFLHADFRKESIQRAINQDSPLNEPYTPAIQGISLDYSAESAPVDLNADDEAGFSNPDVQFFHVGCFGQAREHAFLRRRTTFVSDKQVRLLPAYPDEGELIIGLAGSGPGEPVNLLLQVAEGSANPELAAQALSWSVLCDNYWRPFKDEERVLDTSNDLRTSGILSLALPPETDTEHTWLPSGYVWLKAAAHRDSGAACRLIEVAANAVEVVYVEAGSSSDALHLAAPLAAGSIAKAKSPAASVKKLAQPYAGFGGRQQETTDMLTRRSAERLRHRQRCITPWDYERLLLEAFPAIHKVKCIPHARPGSWLAPGHVLLVAIPDLRNQNAVDPLRPRVDLNTLTLMREHAQAHCGPQVTLHVKNPSYQAVRVSCRVRFKAGNPFNFYRGELEQALKRVLSPWTGDAAQGIEFGGCLYRSVLLDLVEELPYVDFVSDFRILTGGSDAASDPPFICAAAPDVILVSDDSHSIAELTD